MLASIFYEFAIWINKSLYSCYFLMRMPVILNWI